jgi:hypothetical protein
MRRGLVIAILGMIAACLPCSAQQEVCGLTSMTEGAFPLYPAIAKAAHVEGNVIMLVSFKLDGAVDHIDVISGPKMLQNLLPDIAVKYVQSWKANAYGGPRTCPVVITFTLLGIDKFANIPGRCKRIDLQHVEVCALRPAIEALSSDPSVRKSGF